MPRTRVWIVSVVLALTFGSSLGTTQTAPPRHHKVPKKQAELPPLPVGPLSPVPMDQIPAAAPFVNYQQGLLTIVAQNSTLADILLDVRKLTGASIDVPSNATERVVTRLGPGPVRDVLAGLLNGTGFNYVMVGSHSDPSALSALVLTAKSEGGPGGAAVANTPMAMVEQPGPAFSSQPMPQPVAPQVGNPAVAEADDSEDDSDSDEDAKATVGPGGPGAEPLGPEPTPEQLQQMREKLGPPPNAPQRPLLVTPTNPPNQQ